MKTNIIHLSHHPLAAFESAAFAEMDLRAYPDTTFVLKPLEHTLIPTGSH